VARRALAAVAGNGTVRKVALSTPFVRDVAWRFVAGEDLAAGLAVVRELNARGMKATLNYVGTHVRSETEAIAAADEAIAALRALDAAGLDSHLSVKLTQIGLDVRPELCRDQLRRVLDCARDVGIFVRIDMEESRYVEATIDLFEEARDAYGAERVGIALQSYLRDRRGDLGRLAAAGSRIRLVKGGYWEPADVVFQAKRDVDRAFLADIEQLMRAAPHPAIATHDPAAIDTACRATAAMGRDRATFEFQMLYGVRPDLQHRLVRKGFMVRCYVPYGGQWYAYVLGCLRRVPEGTLQRARERAGLGPRSSAGAKRRRLARATKRGVDVVGAAVGLAVLSPLLAWVALAVAATMGPPILFRQKRPGRHGRAFTILKFRTMRPPGPGEVWYETDVDRVTRLGRFLRSTSIDELPELWNVLRGDMSLVGPRPLFSEYLTRYTARERRRHEMRPGITGWAAVSGRHLVPFEERLELDVWYVDSWSLWLDIKILARTVGQVLSREGVRSTQDFADIDFPMRFWAGLAGDRDGRVDGERPVGDASPIAGHHDPAHSRESQG